MNNLLTKMLIISALLGFNHIALADWSSDCQQLTAPNLSNPCAPIQNEVSSLNAYMTPAPFLASTVGNFTNVDAGTPPFPNGSPFGAAPAASSGGSSSDVLPPAGTSSSGSSGSSSSGSSSGGTFQ